MKKKTGKKVLLFAVFLFLSSSLLLAGHSHKSAPDAPPCAICSFTSASFILTDSPVCFADKAFAIGTIAFGSRPAQVRTTSPTNCTRAPPPEGA